MGLFSLHLSLLRKRKRVTQSHRHVRGSRDSAWFLALGQGPDPIAAAPEGSLREKGFRALGLWSGFCSFLNCFKRIQLPSLLEKTLLAQAVNYPFIYSSNY